MDDDEAEHYIDVNLEATVEQISLKLDLIIELLEKIAYPDVFATAGSIVGKTYESAPTVWDPPVRAPGDPTLPRQRKWWHSV